MTAAPQCQGPDRCGPFGVPGGESPHIACACCGWQWRDERDYALAVVAEKAFHDEAIAWQRVQGDRKALAAWEVWAAQHR